MSRKTQGEGNHVHHWHRNVRSDRMRCDGCGEEAYEKEVYLMPRPIPHNPFTCKLVSLERIFGGEMVTTVVYKNGHMISQTVGGTFLPQDKCDRLRKEGKLRNG